MVEYALCKKDKTIAVLLPIVVAFSGVTLGAYAFGERLRTDTSFLAPLPIWAAGRKEWWEMKKITDRYGIPLIINDRIDIAMAVGTAGVHIGQKDIPADIARKVIGQDMLHNGKLHPLIDYIEKIL